MAAALLRLRSIGSGLAALALAGCGGSDPGDSGNGPGPVDSGNVTIRIDSINESDIRTAGTVQKDGNISTGTGNPWGTFVGQAKAECGKDPVGFEVTSLSIGLDTSGGGSTTTRFEDVVDGAATVFFASTQGSDAAATKADVGSVSAPTGAGPVAVPVSATRSSLDPLLARLVGGDFHVGFRAATSLTDRDDFSMDVRVTLAARAHCE